MQPARMLEIRSAKLRRVTAGRQVDFKLYAYEWILIAHLVVLTIVARAESLEFLSLFRDIFRAIEISLLSATVGGIALRAGHAAFSGRWPRYRAVITSPGWIVDTIRLVIAEAALTLVYGWMKLVVPVFNHRLFDQQLWDIDRAISFGFSPNLFVLALFSNSSFLRLIDWAYANIFVATMLIAFAYFLSAPSRRLRLAFMTSNVLLWIWGAYLYLLVPSLGPAYRFPQLWFEYAAQLQTTQRMQALLMRNYTNMLALNRGVNTPVSLIYGIAAFPSLHVAWQALVALWMRREWVYGEVLFSVMLFVIFIGSMITGWHYLVDGIAGVVLALAAYYAVVRSFKLRRWFALHRSLRVRRP